MIQQIRVSAETLAGAPCAGAELRPARGEGRPTEEAGVQRQVFKKDPGWQRDAADRAVLQGRRHSWVGDECL